jgi:hypothetical protein
VIRKCDGLKDKSNAESGDPMREVELNQVIEALRYQRYSNYQKILDDHCDYPPAY